MPLSDSITDGPRGLCVPEFLRLTVEYTVSSIVRNGVFRIADGPTMKAVGIESENPLTLARNLPKLGVSAIIAFGRRKTAVMAVLKMRGFPLPAPS